MPVATWAPFISWDLFLGILSQQVGLCEHFWAGDDLFGYGLLLNCIHLTPGAPISNLVKNAHITIIGMQMKFFNR